jgi:hypothetical protein
VTDPGRLARLFALGALAAGGCYAQTAVGGALPLARGETRGGVFAAPEVGARFDPTRTVRVSAGFGFQLSSVEAKGERLWPSAPLSIGLEWTVLRREAWLTRLAARGYGLGTVRLGEEPRGRWFGDEVTAGFVGLDLFRIDLETKPKLDGGEIGFGFLLGAFVTHARPPGRADLWTVAPTLTVMFDADALAILCQLERRCAFWAR